MDLGGLGWESGFFTDWGKRGFYRNRLGPSLLETLARASLWSLSTVNIQYFKLWIPERTLIKGMDGLRGVTNPLVAINLACGSEGRQEVVVKWKSRPEKHLPPHLQLLDMSLVESCVWQG